MNRHKKVVALTGVFLMALSIVACGQVKEDGIVSKGELSTIQQDNSTQTSDEHANSEIKKNKTAGEGESVTNQQEMESINPELFPVGKYQDEMGSQLIISKGDGNQYMVTFGIYKLAYMENAEGNYDVDSGTLSFSGTEDMGNTLSADVRVKGENLIVTLTHSEYGANTCPPGTEFEFKPMENASESAKTAYAAFLAGNTSKLDSENMYAEALNTWKHTSESAELEYTYLDVDRDGVEELLIQWIDDPGSFNGVFHYADGKLYCWQYDDAEGNCRDYPLQDGTMVRQYDSNGTRSYTVFRYQANGETVQFFNLFAREELIPEDSTNPCPYYEVNGKEVDKTVFDEQLDDLIINQMLKRLAWTTI